MEVVTLSDNERGVIACREKLSGLMPRRATGSLKLLRAMMYLCTSPLSNLRGLKRWMKVRKSNLTLLKVLVVNKLQT